MAELSVEFRTALRSCASAFLVEAQRVTDYADILVSDIGKWHGEVTDAVKAYSDAKKRLTDYMNMENLEEWAADFVNDSRKEHALILEVVKLNDCLHGKAPEYPNFKIKLNELRLAFRLNQAKFLDENKRGKVTKYMKSAIENGTEVNGVRFPGLIELGWAPTNEKNIPPGMRVFGAYSLGRLDAALAPYRVSDMAFPEADTVLYLEL